MEVENTRKLEELTEELEKSHRAEIDELRHNITLQYEGRCNDRNNIFACL